jgi:AraC-like DNA-binding protein
VLRDLRHRPLGAVLVSVGRCDEREAASLARVVREFPRVPTYALLSHVEPTTPRTVLSIGRSGVHTLIDVRTATGWRDLRATLMADRAGDIERLAIGQLALDLAGAPPSCHRFFELLFGRPERVVSVRALATALGSLPTTLMSRFFRARLPAPKRYLAIARLVQAARLFENPGLSIANVADHLDYSSPQSFGRHLRTLMGMTASAFRQRYDGEGMLGYFRDALVLPHLATLRVFAPIAADRVRARRAIARDAAAARIVTEGAAVDGEEPPDAPGAVGASGAPVQPVAPPSARPPRRPRRPELAVAEG